MGQEVDARVTVRAAEDTLIHPLTLSHGSEHRYSPSIAMSTAILREEWLHVFEAVELGLRT